MTDDSWSSFLRARPYLDEVNFWQPKPQRFKVVSNGQPFLFKSHAPSNQLIGGGFLSGWAVMPTSRAWTFFGEGNGVGSLKELRSLIGRYRAIGVDEDPEIGCVALRDVFFASPGEEVGAPPDFAPNIIRYKGYDLTTPSGLYVEAALEHLTRHRQPTPNGVPGPVWGDPRLERPRIGQIAFKSLVESAYHRRCAITGSRIIPTLQAGHIRPISHGGQNMIANGLLLRADVHRLYDDGYIGVDTHGRIHVSPRLRSEFGNGEEFYARSGTVIDLPDNRADRPSGDVVTWHMETKFKAS